MVEGVRELQAVLALVTIIPWIGFIKTHKHYWGYAIAPIAFLLHIAIFNAYIVYVDANGISHSHLSLSYWSIIIRIQGILSCAILGVGLFADLKTNGYNGTH